MKLRTKFQGRVFGLGEVVEADLKEENNRIKVSIAAKAGGYHTFYYDSIEDFTNEWEDAHGEPKKYWCIEENGCVDFNYYDGGSYAEDLQEIGNYFETEEEAKKTVKKLMAWQRLKDKGFRFKGWDWEDDPSKIEIQFRCPDESCLSLFDIQDDLDLLFCTEVKNE